MTQPFRPDPTMGRLPTARAGNDPQILRLLGEASLGKGEARAATMLFRRAVRLAPEQSGLKAALGGAYFAAGQYERAAGALNEALRAAPSEADSHGNMGTMLRFMGRRAEAVDQHRRAVALRPGSAEAHTSLADALREIGEVTDAINAYQRALALKPDSIVAHVHLGQALTQVGRLTEAVAVFQRARTLRPTFADTYVDLGRSLLALGETKSALAQFDQAIERDPDHADAHWCRAQVHLLSGDIEAAWVDYPWRRHADAKAFPTPALPLWDGRDLGSGTLLVTAAPSVAETILMARFMAKVAPLAGKVVVQAPADMVDLLGRARGVTMAVAPDASPVTADAYMPLVLLPCLFGIDLATLAADMPYLSFAAPAPHDPATPTVGLAPAAGSVSLLSPPRNAMLDLGLVPQIGSVTTIESSDGSIADLVERILATDLVIAADPVVAHLAGALGHPTWVLLSSAPDWWWLQERDDSPWYPSARLFRQSMFGDWNCVFAAVAAALSNRA